MKFRLVFIVLFFSNLKIGNCQLDLIDNSYNSFFYQDSSDIWISSERGWNRCNSKGCEHYLSIDTINGLKGTFIQSHMYADNQGYLWSSTYEFLTKYSLEDNKFESLDLSVLDKSITEQGYHVFDIDIESESLYLKIGSFLYIYNYSDNSISKLSNLPTKGTRFYFNGSDEIIACPWLLDSGIEIWTKDDSNNWEKNVLKLDGCFAQGEKITFSQALEVEDKIWLVSNLGLFELDALEFCNSNRYPLTKNVTLSYAVSFEQYILVTSEFGGLFIFDTITKSLIKNITTEDKHIKLSSNRPIEIFKDREDNVWISHRNIGLDKLAISKLIHSTSIQNEKEYPILYSTGNDLYYNDGPSFIKRNKESKTKVKSLSDSQIIQIGEHDKDIIIASKIHLEVMGTDLKTIEKIEIELGEIIDLYINEKLYVIISTRIFEMLRDGKLIPLKNEIAGFRKIVEVNDTFLMAIRGSSEVYIDRQQGQSSIDVGSYINDVKVISNDLFYVATNEGLFKCNYNSCDRIKEIPFATSIYSIVHNKSDIFISSDIGILKLNKSGEGVNKIPNTEKCRNLLFYEENIVGSYQGFFQIHDLGEFDKNQDIRLMLDSAVINGITTYQREAFSKSLKLNNRENNIEFHFRTLGTLTDMLIDYKIDGPYREEGQFKSFNSLNFNRLPAGKYSLDFIGKLPNFDFTEARTINFTISPPYYETWWFRLAVGLTLFGFGFIINFMKTKSLLKKKQIELDRQKALQEQRNRMAHDLHDEMGSGLATIKHMSSQGKESNSSSKLSQIEDLSVSLIGSMRMMLWSLDESNDSVKNVFSKIRETCNKRLRANGISPSFEVSETIVDRSISGPDRRHIVLMVKEVLANVIKHSQATHVMVKLESHDSSLIISISDNGVGYETSKSSDGLGIKSLINRAKVLNGNIAFDSPAAGTKVIINISPF